MLRATTVLSVGMETTGVHIAYVAERCFTKTALLEGCFLSDCLFLRLKKKRLCCANAIAANRNGRQLAWEGGKKLFSGLCRRACGRQRLGRGLAVLLVTTELLQPIWRPRATGSSGRKSGPRGVIFSCRDRAPRPSPRLALDTRTLPGCSISTPEPPGFPFPWSTGERR